jgi:hypothetical protein
MHRYLKILSAVLLMAFSTPSSASEDDKSADLRFRMAWVVTQLQDLSECVDSLALHSIFDAACIARTQKMQDHLEKSSKFEGLQLIEVVHVLTEELIYPTEDSISKAKWAESTASPSTDPNEVRALTRLRKARAFFSEHGNLVLNSDTKATLRRRLFLNDEESDASDGDCQQEFENLPIGNWKQL